MDKKCFFIKIADMIMGVECNYASTRNLCRDYIVYDNKACIQIAITKKEIEEWKERFPEYSEEYEESLCLCTKIAEQVPFYDGFLFHGSVITFQEQGFIFTAPSGTGKSTHIRLWKKYLGKTVDIVNGDKPILRVENNGSVRAYGTPWSGKEGWQKNRSARLQGVCFLKRGLENSIRRLRPEECLEMLFHQVFLPKNAEGTGRTMDLLDKMVTSVPLYLLECDMSEEAVKCSFEALTGLEYRQYRQD